MGARTAQRGWQAIAACAVTPGAEAPTRVAGIPVRSEGARQIRSGAGAEQ